MFVRQYAEDRELTAWLLLDHSPSMGFGPVDRTKELVLREVAATIARCSSGAATGSAPSSTTTRSRGRSRPGRAATRCSPSPGSCCRPVDGRGRGRPTSASCSTPPPGVIRRRSLVVLISDFISAPGWERPLLRLTERHEVVAIRLVDPREFELPDAGLIVVQDAETGEQLVVDSSDPEFRRRLASAGDEREQAVRARGHGGPASTSTWSRPTTIW